jgi:hypothetical protein
VKLPLWVRALDAAAVLALILTVFVFLFGGFAIYFSLNPVRVHSTGRLLFFAVALLAVRHVAYPASPLPARLAGWLRGAGERPAGSAAALGFSSRVCALLIGYMAVATIGVNTVTTGFELSADKLSNLPARFDAGWYGGIAVDGYSFGGSFKRQQNIAFFPAFPLLMRAVGYPIGAFGPGMPKEKRVLRLLWGGLFLSIFAFAWASAYLWRLARDIIGESRATDAVALLAAYPFSIFYSAPYTESLFLLGAVAAVYHFRRDEWVKAGAWGLLVGLTRPNGCFLSLVLAAFVAERLWRERAAVSGIPPLRVAASLVSAAMPGVGMLGFSVYVHSLTGSFFGWARMHEAAWGRTYQGLAPVQRAYGWITDEGLVHVVEGVPFDTLNSLGLIFALIMVWPVLRKAGPALALFVLINVIPPMLAGGVLSLGRLSATLFPAFIALAAITSPRVTLALITAFAIGQGLAAAIFFTWRPLF